MTSPPRIVLGWATPDLTAPPTTSPRRTGLAPATPALITPARSRRPPPHPSGRAGPSLPRSPTSSRPGRRCRGPTARADARDRLLAALLDDPLRAVGATVDLQDCLERIDSLGGALRDERARLGEVLARLAGSGLRSDQLARLSGLSDADVDELLRRNVAG